MAAIMIRWYRHVELTDEVGQKNSFSSYTLLGLQQQAENQEFNPTRYWKLKPFLCGQLDHGLLGKQCLPFEMWCHICVFRSQTPPIHVIPGLCRVYIQGPLIPASTCSLPESPCRGQHLSEDHKPSLSITSWGSIFRAQKNILGTTFEMANIVFLKAHDLIDHIKKDLAFNTLWN